MNGILAAIVFICIIFPMAVPQIFILGTLYFHHVSKFVKSKVGHFSCQLNDLDSF